MKDGTLKVICLLATACTGKTTYMNSIAGVKYKDYKPEFDSEHRPVTLSMGNFFRETLGSEFFIGRDTPCAPYITNDWAKNLMHRAMEMAHINNRDMITDGFPRTEEQLKWLLNSSYVSSNNVMVEIRFLFADEVELSKRQAERLSKCTSDVDRKFLQERMNKDRSSFIQVQQGVKRMLESGDYPKLSSIEVNV